MKNFVLFTLGLLSFFSTVQAQETLRVGYFSEWPLPAHYDQSSGAYDEMLGAETEWSAFDSSTDMFAALETGEIQIALSQGLVPFLLVATAGLDFKIVDIAVSYPAGENCVAHPDLRFSATNSATLTGATIALAVGTTAHFNLNQALAHFGVAPSSVKLVNMPPAQAAAALAQGKVDIACGWGPALDTLLDFGTLLLDNDQKSAIGVKNYDTIVIKPSFGADNPEVVATFLKITAELNSSFTANPSRMIPKIAGRLNMTESAVTASMNGFEFPSTTEKLGVEWMGGDAQLHMKVLADFFVNQNVAASALESYESVVDKSYLERAANLPLIGN
ncbi:hypothetical protein A9Q96_16035 [Rhodobacterales bacterium 52_120_T64]|nr:hypothetical protein A9Q96_16035 [Rhodobacterales bacterium 52_120_T64]